MKIVYCLNSIRGFGGIQKVVIVKANALAEMPGNEVYLVVTDHKKGTLHEPLSDKVHLIDLHIDYYADDWKSRWHVLKGVFVKRRAHKKRLSATLHRIEPDIVISVGQCEQHFLPSIKGDFRKIREFHFVRDYRYRHAVDAFSYLLALCSNLYERISLRKYDRIVVLTREDKETNWKGNRKVTVIPNPLTFQPDDALSTLTEKTVITAGRLEHQKNYDSLIRAWHTVAEKHPDWKLEIYGEGSKRQEWQQLIETLNLQESVFLKGASSEIRKRMLHSSMFACSSLYEGFSLVLIEAMSCGLPVVSYTCPCGPKDIVTEGKDGFLVPVNDEKSLAERICHLIEHPQERIVMGQHAKTKSKQYHVQHIMRQWMDLFENLKTNGVQ